MPHVRPIELLGESIAVLSLTMIPPEVRIASAIVRLRELRERMAGTEPAAYRGEPRIYQPDGPEA